MYDSIRIQNFRGIQDLTISDLGRINLIVGANDVGKTSVLEALALLHMHSDFFEIRQILESRGFVAGESPAGGLSSLFNASANAEIVIRANNAKENRYVVANNGPISRVSSVFRDLASRAGGTRTSSEYRLSLGMISEEVVLDYGRVTGPEAPPIVNPNKWEQPIDLRTGYPLPSPQQEHEFGEVAYLPSNARVKHRLLPELVTSLSRLGRLDSAITALNAFDPRLLDLEVAAVAGQVSVDAVMASNGASDRIRVPWSALGDGVRRLWEMLVMLPRASHGVGLIDEIDYGVYFQNLPKLWAAVSSISLDANVQLFATTHSWECVSAAVQELERSSDATFRLHRISRRHGELAVTTYPLEDAEAAIELNVEVR